MENAKIIQVGSYQIKRDSVIYPEHLEAWLGLMREFSQPCERCIFHRQGYQYIEDPIKFYNNTEYQKFVIRTNLCYQNECPYHIEADK